MINIKRLIFRNIERPYRYNYTNLLWAMVLNGIFCACYGPFFGVIAREQYHATPFLLGLIFASMNLSGFASYIVAGFVPKGKEHIFTKYDYFVASIFLFLSPFTKSAVGFCLMLFCFHFFACYAPLETTVYAYIFPLNVRSKFLGYGRAASTGTSLLLTFIVGMIININLYGIQLWTVIFMIGAIAHGLKGFFLGNMKLPKDIKCEEKSNHIEFIKNSMKYLYKDKFNIILIISGIFFTIGTTFFTTLNPIFQVDVLHINGKEVSLLSVISGISSLIIYPVLGNYFTKKNPISAWLYVFPLALISPIIYLLLKDSWYPLIIGSILGSAYGVVLDLCWLNLIIYFGGKNKIREYQALYGLINGFRAIVGLFVASSIISKCEKLTYDTSMNLKIAFLIGMVFVILAGFISLGLLKYKNIEV